MSYEKVHKAVEDICKLGCTTVNEVIDILEKGDDVAESEALDKHERNELLKELKAIMDVYDRE